MTSDHAYHRTRFRPDPRREAVWQVLWESYFSRLVAPEDWVLDLGAGYCQFINQVRCARRFAVDVWPGTLDHAAPGVEAFTSRLSDLSFLPDASIGLALASNVFEHLEREELSATLREVRRKLRPDGTLAVLQPNYRFAYREYFDDFTHVTVLSDRSLGDLLRAHGFRVLESIPRFLPLTIESRLPVWKPLVRLYLRLPVRPLGKQMLVRAVPLVSDPPPL